MNKLIKLALKYFINDRKSKNTFILLFLLYILICIFASIFFFYDYKLNITIDEKMYIDITVENKEVLNNKIIEKKECKDYKITYCRIPINRYNQNEIIEYLKEKNISYYISNETEKLEHFTNIKYTLLVIVILFTILGFILITNQIKKKQEFDLKTKYIMHSLGYTKQKLIIFDFIYIIPLFTIYFLISESLLFIISYITSNLEFYKLYFSHLNCIFLIFILLYLVIYYVLLKLNDRKLTI